MGEEKKVVEIHEVDCIDEDEDKVQEKGAGRQVKER